MKLKGPVMNEVRTTRPFFDIALGGTAPKFREIVCPSRRENPKPGGERLPPSRPRLYFRVPHGEAPAEPSPSCPPLLRGIVPSCAIHPGFLSAPPRLRVKNPSAISPSPYSCISSNSWSNKFPGSAIRVMHLPWISACQLVSVSAFVPLCTAIPTYSNRTGSDLNSVSNINIP